jgi:hypothetical protein
MRIGTLLGRCSSVAIGAAAIFAITSSVYGDLSHPTRVTLVLVTLLLLHALRYLRLWVSRELLLVLGFFGYSVLTLAWTEDLNAGIAAVPSLLNLVIILVLFSSLAAYHHIGALLTGTFLGFIASAVLYTLTSGFPFSYPEDFSYNTMADFYLIGLFITLLWGTYLGRPLLMLPVAAVLVLLIAVTTSIKTNLGVVLGVLAASLLYFRPSARQLATTVVVLAVLALGVGYGVVHSPTLLERLHNGVDRVSTGLDVLTNRVGDSGATGLGNREGWTREGLKGWAATPVFGHGIEAFRADFGITSHSTPIDLLYNAGIIGCGLFYAVLASVAWRLVRAGNPRGRAPRACIAGCLIAYSFMSLSGNVYYDPFLAIFVGLATGLVTRLEHGAGVAAESQPSVAGGVVQGV